jgi:RHS repeat-associated protein
LTGDANQPYAWDYFIKDHLGNVRMVLTEETKVEKYPLASLETSKIAMEKNYYNISDAQVVDAPVTMPTYTNDNGIGNNPSDVTFEQANSQKVYRLNSNVQKTGLGITLKVMAGDRIDVFGKSYYYQNNTGGTGVNLAIPVLEILTGLVGGPGSVISTTAREVVSASSLEQLTPTTSGIGGLFSTQAAESSLDPQMPKAYINYLFFNEQFKCVGSGYSKVGANGTLKQHFSDLQGIEAAQNGYVYIYCSNESPVDVFFDNLQVVHTKGPMLEDTHYYPFGLTMAGISSRAAGVVVNRQRYNDGTELENGEFSDGSGLEIYATSFRGLDPQIGRFWQIDAMADDYEGWSPYAFAMNNPVNLNDPTGLFADSTRAPDGEMVADKGAMEVVTVKYSPKSSQNYSWWGLFADANQNNNYLDVYNHLENQGVNERGLRLFDLAWQGIEYRKRVAELEAEWRDFVGDAFIEGATWVVGGAVLKIGGKAVSLGYRGYKALKAIRAAKKGGNAFRYMSQAELEAVQSTGLLRGGRAGETFFTKDLYKSAASAQNRLALPGSPALRVEFQILNNPSLLRNGTKVLPANGMMGKGAEFMTLDPVKVRLINWQPLR